MRPKLVFSLLVAGLAVALYANSVPGEFVFDDHEAIESNMDVRTDTPLSSVFSNDFWGLPLSNPESHKSYRPFTILSFRLNRILHEMWPPGFHIVNIAAHALVSVLFMQYCLKLGTSTFTSLVASLFFVSHPIHTEAVANIVGRTEILSAIFFLLSLMAYQKSLTKEDNITNSLRSKDHYRCERQRTFSPLWLIFTVFLAVVSMLCKEQGIVALGVCLAYDILVVCKINLSSIVTTLRYIVLWSKGQMDAKQRQLPTWVRSLMKRTLVLVLCTATTIFLRIFIIGGGSPSFVDSDNPASFSPYPQTRFLTYSYLCAVNLWLLLCPSCLCFDWSMGSIPLIESISDWRNLATVGGAALIVLLSAFGLIGDQKTQIASSDSNHFTKISSTNEEVHSNGVTSATPHAASPHRKGRKREAKTSTIHHRGVSLREKKKQLLLFSLVLLILPFLPASNLFFRVGFVVAERVLYLPSLGACLLVAVGLSSLREPTRKTSKWRQTMATAIGFTILLLFSTKTLVRNWEWRNTRALAESGLKVNWGNAKVQMTMGNVLAQQGNRTCEAFYRMAVQLRPQYTAAWTNLGLILLNTGRPQEAEDCYRRALSFKADHINANTNMGHLCRLQERWREALEHYLVAVKRRPGNPILHYFIGVVSEKIGTPEKVKQAEMEFTEAVELHINYWEAHLALARLLATSSPSGQRLQGGYSKGKRADKAVSHYQTALQLKPEDSNSRYELGTFLLWKGNVKQAEVELQTATQLSPNHALAHLELGNAYEKMGDRRRAAVEFRTALELNGTLTVAKQKFI